MLRPSLEQDEQTAAFRLRRDHRKAEQVDPELAGQEREPILNPLPAVVVVATGERVVSTEKRTTDAAADAVKDAGLGGVDQLFSRNPRHWPAFGDGKSESAITVLMNTDRHHAEVPRTCQQESIGNLPKSSPIMGGPFRNVPRWARPIIGFPYRPLFSLRTVSPTADVAFRRYSARWYPANYPACSLPYTDEPE